MYNREEREEEEENGIGEGVYVEIGVGVDEIEELERMVEQDVGVEETQRQELRMQDRERELRVLALKNSRLRQLLTRADASYAHVPPSDNLIGAYTRVTGRDRTHYVHLPHVDRDAWVTRVRNSMTTDISQLEACVSPCIRCRALHMQPNGWMQSAVLCGAPEPRASSHRLESLAHDTDCRVRIAIEAKAHHQLGRLGLARESVHERCAQIVRYLAQAPLPPPRTSSSSPVSSRRVSPSSSRPSSPFLRPRTSSSSSLSSSPSSSSSPSLHPSPLLRARTASPLSSRVSSPLLLPRVSSPLLLPRVSSPLSSRTSSPLLLSRTLSLSSSMSDVSAFEHATTIDLPTRDGGICSGSTKQSSSNSSTVGTRQKAFDTDTDNQCEDVRVAVKPKYADAYVVLQVVHEEEALDTYRPWHEATRLLEKANKRIMARGGCPTPCPVFRTVREALQHAIAVDLMANRHVNATVCTVDVKYVGSTSNASQLIAHSALHTALPNAPKPDPSHDNCLIMSQNTPAPRNLLSSTLLETLFTSSKLLPLSSSSSSPSPSVSLSDNERTLTAEVRSAEPTTLGETSSDDTEMDEVREKNETASVVSNVTVHAFDENVAKGKACEIKTYVTSLIENRKERPFAEDSNATAIRSATLSTATRSATLEEVESIDKEGDVVVCFSDVAQFWAVSSLPIAVQLDPRDSNLVRARHWQQAGSARLSLPHPSTIVHATFSCARGRNVYCIVDVAALDPTYVVRRQILHEHMITQLFVHGRLIRVLADLVVSYLPGWMHIAFANSDESPEFLTHVLDELHLK